MGVPSFLLFFLQVYYEIEVYLLLGKLSQLLESVVISYSNSTVVPVVITKSFSCDDWYAYLLSYFCSVGLAPFSKYIGGRVIWSILLIYLLFFLWSKLSSSTLLPEWGAGTGAVCACREMYTFGILLISIWVWQNFIFWGEIILYTQRMKQDDYSQGSAHITC